MIVINSSTRQFNIPGADLVFGVEADSGSTVKGFQCPRYVGNHLDLTGCFIRMNYRNANGEIDEYLVKDVTVDGDNVVFGWELTPKVTMYKGNISFVMCVTGPDTKVKWHTTLGRGQVLEGLEPDNSIIEPETADVVAQLIAMVEAQTDAVEAEGSKQIKAVQTAAQTAQSDAVAQIEAKGVNTRNSIPADYTALSEAVDGLVRGRAGAIVCSAEGSAITMNDASDLPMQGMKIFGRSTQDGTPTPDAPVEIKSVVEPVVTVCGKNLLNVDEHFTFTGAKGLDVYLPSGDYVLSFESETHEGANHPEFRFYDNKNWTTVEGNSVVKRITLSKPETKIYIYSNGTSNANSTGVSATIEKLMVSKVGGDYESYVGQTLSITHTLPGIPVTSGGNYTDSDGQQWICDEVDLERGVYVQRVKSTTLDGDNIPPYYATHQENGQPYCALYPNDIMNYSPVVSSAYRYTATNWSNSNNYLYCVGKSIIINDNRFTNAEVAKNLWSTEKPVIQYVLATPIETTLSETEIAAYRALHSNYPNTTVLNDAGAHMVVEYAADTKLYIDNKIAALVGGV